MVALNNQSFRSKAASSVPQACLLEVDVEDLCRGMGVFVDCCERRPVGCSLGTVPVGLRVERPPQATCRES